MKNQTLIRYNIWWYRIEVEIDYITKLVLLFQLILFFNMEAWYVTRSTIRRHQKMQIATAKIYLPKNYVAQIERDNQGKLLLY